MTGQTEGEKEEVLRVWWVDVSLGFLIEWFKENIIYNINRFVLQESEKNVEGVWLWRISGGYSQEMMGLVLVQKQCKRAQIVFSRTTRVRGK